MAGYPSQERMHASTRALFEMAQQQYPPQPGEYWPQYGRPGHQTGMRGTGTYTTDAPTRPRWSPTDACDAAVRDREELYTRAVWYFNAAVGGPIALWLFLRAMVGLISGF